MTVTRASVIWACAAATGASYLVVGFALALREIALPSAREIELALTNRMVYLGGLSEAILLSIAFGVGAGTGAFVARRAGGARAVVLYVAPVLVAGVSFIAAAALREQELRGIQCCVVATVADTPLAAALACLPTLLGMIIGAALARRRSGFFGTNALLEAAGTYAVVAALAVAGISPLLWEATAVPQLLAMAPYLTVQLEPTAHAFVLAGQALAAAIVFALRGGAVSLRTSARFVVIALAGVAYFDLLEIWLTLTLDHHYTPLSIVIVPMVTVVVCLVVIKVLAQRWTSMPRSRIENSE